MGPQSVTPSETETLTIDGQPRRKRRWGRRLLLAAGVLLVLLAGLVVLAPTIAAPIVRSALTGPRPDGSTLDIASLRLGWTGPQRIESLTIIDANGQTTADLDASLDRGLLALLTNRNDLGTLTLSGSLTLEPPAPGTPREPRDGSGGQGGGRSGSVSIEQQLANLTAALDVPSLIVTFKDPAGPPIVATVRGSGAIAPGTPSTASFHADIAHGGRTGSADVNLADITLGRGPIDGVPIAALQATLAAKDLPSAMLDQLARQQGRFASLLGETATADARITVAPAAADADITLASPRASLDGTLRLADGVLTGAGPVTATVSGEALAAQPEVAAAAADAGLTLTTAPSLALTLTDLRLPLPDGPFDPRTYDARRVSAVAVIELGAAGVTVPAERLALTGAPRAITTRPARFTLTAVDPAGEVRLEGAVETALDGASAGSLQVDLRAAGLLTPAGNLQLGTLPRLAGTLVARGVPTALAQPLAAGAGLDLPRDVGPALDLTLVARAESAGSPTAVSITAVADRLNASGAFLIDGPSLRSDGPATLRLAEAGPALASRLADSGLTLDATGPVEITLDRVSVNTVALGATPPDLSGATARARVQVGPVRGAMTREAGPLAFEAPRSTFDAVLEGGVLAVDGAIPSLRLGGAPAAGPTEAHLRIASPLASPRVTGTVTLTQLDTAALGAAAGDDRTAGLLAAMGPSLNVTIRPDITAGGTTAAQVDVVGAEVDLSGSASLAASGLTADARIHRLGTGIVDALAARPGLGASALGPTASGVVTLTAARDSAGAIGAPLEAMFELTSPRLRTAAPVRVSVSESAAQVMGNARVDWTLEPEALIALIGAPAGAGGAPAEPPVALVASTPVRLEIKRVFFPLRPDAGAMAAEVDLSTTAFALRAPGGEVQQFEAMSATLRTTDTPGQVRADARLRSPGEEGDTLTAQLTADGLLKDGALDTSAASITGFVRARRVPAGLIDAFAGTKGNAAQMLGAHANARLDLDRFPLEGGTATLSAGSPNAQVEYAGAVQGGILQTTAPASLSLRRIEQGFGFTLAKFIPIVGGITKATSDQPATITIPSLGLPLDGDVRKIALDLTADPGTGTLAFERGIASLIDPKVVQQGRTMGESFQPFRVAMRDGVLTVTDFVLPIGDVSIPAFATFDLVQRTEDIVVQLPASALLGDALRGDLAPLRGILGSALNPPLRQRGPMGADNPWKIDPSWKAPDAPDPGKQLLDGLGGLLKDQLNRDREKKQPQPAPEGGESP